MKEMQYIAIEQLHPHPDNPRKELGDLTELSASIKQSGIYQNLTVVPREEGGYTVVIGHRRRAAAKLAGLTDLPCIVADMSYKEQISTMLLENMQRSDLTVYEQAQGFQMMLNMGDSIADIASGTGLSESTIRRRVKLLELDSAKFKAAEARGGTLLDFAEVSKIKSIELRNEVLDAVGTANFNNKLKSALDKEKTEERIEEKPYKALLAALSGYCDGAGEGYWRNEWRPEKGVYAILYKDNEKLNRFYKLLCSLGYEMSDDEREMQEGSSNYLQPDFVQELE